MRSKGTKICLACILLAMPVFAFFLLSFPATLAWESIAPGIEYRIYHQPGPNNVYVVRADRHRRDWVLDTMVGQGKLRTGFEPLSTMVTRYDGMVNYGKEAYRAVAAINGDYFSYETNQSSGGQIASGNFINRFMESKTLASIGWKRDGSVFLGNNLTNRASQQRVFFQKGQGGAISNINSERGTDQLVLYTSQYAERTFTNDYGTEILVRANYPILPGKTISGRVLEKRIHQPGMAIPFDCLVLSGHGKGEQLLGSVDSGDTVSIQLNLLQMPNPFAGGSGNKARWEGTYAGISGDFWYVRNGARASDGRIRNWNAAARHPRTAVAFNSNYLYFIVVDGRSMNSVGMSIPDLAEFCIRELQVREALALDGGGSSTMVVKGAVKNKPSGYIERPIKNALLLATVSPAAASKTFEPSESVRIIIPIDLRLGPGYNYEVCGQFGAKQAAMILRHPFNGIQAQGVSWWKCRFGGTEGWCPETALRAYTGPAPTELLK